MRFETRDPFQEKIKREDAFNCDWDRYAHLEYTRLSQEEEDGNGYSVGSWKQLMMKDIVIIHNIIIILLLVIKYKSEVK